MDIIKVKLLRKMTFDVIPKYGTDGAAAADLVAAIDGPISIAPGGSMYIPSGIAIEINNNQYAAMVLSRSGLGTKHGIVVKQGIGLIDPDYRGEIMVCLQNISTIPYTVNPGDRIAQLLITPIARPQFVATDELNSTCRGHKGFGSTGV